MKIKRMKVITIALATALSFCLLANTSNASEKKAPPKETKYKDGWVSLFDGKTLKGWHLVGDGEWVVEDGAIVGKTQKAAKLYGLLVSDKQYKDLRVKFRFKSLAGNSGFYVRCNIKPPDRAHGLQVEVDPATIPAEYTKATVAPGSASHGPRLSKKPTNSTSGTRWKSWPTALM